MTEQGEVAASSTICYLSGDYAIIRSDAIFGTGFNCYKSMEPVGNEFAKINQPANCFLTEAAAKEWLDNYISVRQSPTE